MANELAWDRPTTGETLYACRFQLNGNVLLTLGSSDEVWGTGGKIAAHYDIPLTESGGSGHFVGSFDPSGNIEEGSYRVVVYLQAGGSPVDADDPIAQGIIHWDGLEAVTVNRLKFM